MNFSKLKKAVSSVTAAVLCVTMAFGTAVSADNSDVWKETKALTSAKYNSKYIKLVEKYSKKETKNTVTFSKSKTKKFIEKQIKALKKDNPQFAVSAISKDEIAYVSYKGDKIKIVMYTDGEGLAIYTNPNEMTMLSVSDKEKIVMPMTDDIGYDDLMGQMLDSFGNFNDEEYYENLGIADNAKGKYYKIKSDDKIYYYEEFKSSEYDKYGFLFNEKGNPIAMIGDDVIGCFSISYSVKDSDFKVPSGYKEVSLY
ncbi:MAG: hypothetical protein K2H23_03640 [Oscillospiraceae bacterium]|nr:hypothetical protein [Oscillospiraceae bacterium]